MHVDDAAGRGLLGAVAFFQDFIQDAVIEDDNPLLLGLDGQEGFIGFLVGVGSFLFHRREFTTFSGIFSLRHNLAQASISFAATNDVSHA